MSKVEQQREHFENISEQYFSARQSPNHLLVKRYIWEYFFSVAGLRNETYNVLEPMCGYAEGKFILEQYGKLDIRYVGFDYSRTLIELVKKEQPDLSISWQDVTSLDEHDYNDRFDLIILIGGLHHVYDNADLVMKKLTGTLKQGGYFINFEPTHDFFLFKMVRDRIYEKNRLFDRDTEQAFSLEELNGIYTRNGLAIVEQMYPGLLSYILYYNPDAFPLLNRGGELAVKALFTLDKLFMRNRIGKKFSFATMTLLRKES